MFDTAKQRLSFPYIHDRGEPGLGPDRQPAALRQARQGPLPQTLGVGRIEKGEVEGRTGAAGPHAQVGSVAAVDAGGAELAFEGLMMGAKTGYLDTISTLGFMTELITANPVAEQVFGAFRAAAEGWDGSDPVRTLG